MDFSSDSDNRFLIQPGRGNASLTYSAVIEELCLYEGTSKHAWSPPVYETAEAVRTVQSQLAGSWAVQNLTSAGSVLGQLNLNKDGSVRINDSLISIGDKTYIKDASIKSAAIQNLNADKITTGTLNGNLVNVTNINASNIVSGTLTGMTLRGGRIEALNGAMKIDLNSGQYEVNTENAAMRRVVAGYPNQFIKFATGQFDGKGSTGVTVIGSNRNGSESSNDGGFVGVRIWNSPSIDHLDLVGDTISLTSSPYDNKDGWHITTMDNRLSIQPLNQHAQRNSFIGVGDVMIYRNNGEGVWLRTVLDNIFDNFRNLNEGGNFSRSYYANW